MIIAIDGPAASGKSSTGALVARHFGLVHVDSGALYRAITWVALTFGLDDATGIIAAAESLPITLERHDGDLVVRSAGQPIDEAIRDAAVTAHVSAVSALPAIRDWANRLLRDGARREGGAVVDGRDIGTVVFPEAALKVFLTATPAARAKRRLLQRGTMVEQAELWRETALLAERDHRDSTRAVAPLRPADDAIVLDTTALDLASQVARIIDLARDRGLSAP